MLEKQKGQYQKKVEKDNFKKKPEKTVFFWVVVKKNVCFGKSVIF